MNKQQLAIKESGLSMKDLERITGIRYCKLSRVMNGETEFKLSELEKINLVNKTIAKLKEECAAE